MATKVVTGKARLSYLTVFEPRAAQGSTDLKYSVAILIPKSDTVTIAALRKAVEEETKAGTTKHGSSWKVRNVPIKDGDNQTDHEYFGEAEAGHWVVNASNTDRPFLVDRNVDPITESRELYSGCFGKVSLNVYHFSNGKGGVTFGLNGIQKIADGEALGGQYTMEDVAKDFGKVEGDTSAAAEFM